MIEQVDDQLRDWVANVVGHVPVSLELPGNWQTDGQGISLYLLELVEYPSLRGAQVPPLQLSLRYLLTTWARELETAHHWLGQLVFAAMAQPGFDVELGPVPAATWSAFGLAPRPSFFLRVPLRQERPSPAMPTVRVPLVQQIALRP